MIVRPAVLEDAALYAPFLRRVDLEELQGALGVDAQVGLEQSIRVSKWTDVILDDDGTPLYLNGLSVWPDGTGCPWLMATDHLLRRMSRRDFLTRTAQTAERMAADTPTLANYVAAHNTTAKRWLMWLGFTILPDAVQMRPGGIPFNLFFRNTHVRPGVHPSRNRPR
jgi:hypothetical protein